MSTHRSADRSFETKSSGSRYRHMRPAPRAWLVLGTCCAVLSASAACSPAPQAGRSSSSPAVSGSPLAPPATLPGGWNAGGNLSTTRWGQMVGVLLQGGRVLVTGTSSDGRGVGNVDIYDPAGGWSPARSSRHRDDIQPEHRHLDQGTKHECRSRLRDGNAAPRRSRPDCGWLRCPDSAPGQQPVLQSDLLDLDDRPDAHAWPVPSVRRAAQGWWGPSRRWG